MGSAIGYRLFMDKEFEVKHAWFDGVVLTEKAAFAEWLMKTMFHRQRRKLLKSHIDASPSIVKMYGHDFARMMTHNLERITEADIDHICYACCHYRLRLLSNEEQTRSKGNCILSSEKKILISDMQRKASRNICRRLSRRSEKDIRTAHIWQHILRNTCRK